MLQMGSIGDRKEAGNERQETSRGRTQEVITKNGEDDIMEIEGEHEKPKSKEEKVTNQMEILKITPREKEKVVAIENDEIEDATEDLQEANLEKKPKQHKQNRGGRPVAEKIERSGKRAGGKCRIPKQQGPNG